MWCLHFFMGCDYLDDVNNRITYSQINGDYISGVVKTYNVWNPRFIIYLVMIRLTGNNV